LVGYSLALSTKQVSIVGWHGPFMCSLCYIMHKMKHNSEVVFICTHFSALKLLNYFMAGREDLLKVFMLF
jgi:hypothetical protein